MLPPEDEVEAAVVDGEASWRDRALERSLRAARAKAMSRSDRFIATAMEILRETGRTDFTVQELVDRSRTSLRSFYQYFAGKDELLLALLEEAITDSAAQWRADVDGLDPLLALEIVVDKVYGQSAGSDSWVGLNRALASYHVSLAESHADDYRRALGPLARLLRDIVEQGVAEGVMRVDISADVLIPVVVQLVVGAAMINALQGSGPAGRSDAATLWAICRSGLEVRPAGTPRGGAPRR